MQFDVLQLQISNQNQGNSIVIWNKEKNCNLLALGIFIILNVPFAGYLFDWFTLLIISVINYSLVPMLLRINDCKNYRFILITKMTRLQYTILRFRYKIEI